MRRIIGYARLSSIEQSENSHALEQQIQRLKDSGAIEIVQDIESGSKSTRKGFKQLKKDIEVGHVEEVIITRTDRLSRSLIDLRNFADLCMSKNCNLRILDQQIDLSTPHGKFMFNIIGSAAELEVDMLRSRVDAGLKHFREQKRAHGIVPFGYLRKDDKYSPNYNLYYDSGKRVWDIAREIIETFLETKTLRETSRILGERYGKKRKDKSTEKDFPREVGLKYWLESPVLRGHVAYYYRTRNKKTQIIPNQHEQLISEAEAEAINVILRQHRSGRKLRDRSELAGLIICAKCGVKAMGSHYNLKYRKGKPSVKRETPKIIWRCRSAYEPVPTCVRQPGIRDEVIQDLVITTLCDCADRLYHATLSPSEKVTDTPEILELEKSIESLMTLPQSQAIIKARKELETELETLRAINQEQSHTSYLLKEELIGAAANPDFWRELSKQDRRQVFYKFVHSVIIEDGQVVDIKLRV